mmetsp:Transcript_12398/g.34813  ORF Transcript_12398/g.34813 Transcript_12398/m.34813 type:complete len:326 (-) Transcript_12398:222-1199(-)
MSATKVGHGSAASAEDVTIHDAAVAAAISNPRRRHGKAKATPLHQPLVSFHRLPKYLRDNEYIVGHYRPGHWSLDQIVWSLFRLHNETFNIWSHLLGFFLFVTLMFITVTMSKQAAAEAVAHHVPRWPIHVFFVGAMSCLLMSAVCHLFGCCKPHVAAIVWRFDYVGIAMLIVSSYFPPVYYGFLCNPFWQMLYLSCISLFGLATVAVSLMDVFQSIRFRAIRATVFSGLGLFGIVPVVHQWAVHNHIPMVQEALIYDVLMGAVYLMGAGIYASRVPERWKPGSFDLAFHSHNVFHLCVVLGAYIHYEASLIFIRWRESDACHAF